MSFASKLGDFTQGLASGLGPGIKLGTDIGAARSRNRMLEEKDRRLAEKEKAALQSKTRKEQETRLERMFKDGAHDAAIEGAVAVGRPDLAEEYRTRRTAKEGLKTDKGIATLGKAAAGGDSDKTASAIDAFKIDEGLGTGVTGTDITPSGEEVPGVWETAPGFGGQPTIDRPAAEAILSAEDQYERQLGEKQQDLADKVVDAMAKDFLKNPGEIVTLGDPASFNTFHRMFEIHMAQSGLGKNLTREQQEGLFAITKRRIRGSLIKALYKDKAITADEAKKYEATMEAWGIDRSAWEERLDLMVNTSNDVTTKNFMDHLDNKRFREAQAMLDTDPTLPDTKKASFKKALKDAQLLLYTGNVDTKREKIVEQYHMRRYPFWVDEDITSTVGSVGDVLEMGREGRGKKTKKVLNNNYFDPFLQKTFDFTKNESVIAYTDSMSVLKAGGGPNLVRSLHEPSGIPPQPAEAPKPSTDLASYKSKLGKLATLASDRDVTIQQLTGDQTTPDVIMSELLKITGNLFDAQVVIEELKNEHPMFEAFFFAQQAPQAPIPFLPQQQGAP